MTKKERRKAIFNKYNGRCAYCGCELKFNKFHVDHIIPKFHAHFYGNRDINDIDNLNPACLKCNNYKGALPLDSKHPGHSFRDQLAKQVERLRKSAQFDRALRFGQIEITESPIVFYYEKYQEDSNV